MQFNKKAGTKVAALSFVIGTSYLVTGLIEMLAGGGEFIGSEVTFIPPIEMAGVTVIPGDFFGGVMLMIIGVVYLTGVKQQVRGEREGLSYLLVGSILATTFFLVYTAIMLSNGVGYVFQFEDWIEWMWLDDLRPGLWLFPLALVGAYLVLTKKEWRE